MSKQLKNFIDDHRSEFDGELPGLQNWAMIEKKLSTHSGSKGQKRYWWAVAAAMVALLAFGGWFLIAGKSDNKDVVADNNDHPSPTRSEYNEWPADYAALAKDFSAVIQQRQTELKNLAKAEPELLKQFQMDLMALDSSYQILHRQAQQTAASQIIIKAMIQNLQLQAELLSKQLYIIENYSTNTKDSHEKSKTRSI